MKYGMKNSYVQNKDILNERFKVEKLDIVNEKFICTKLDILNRKFHCTKCTSIYISIYKNTSYYAHL